MIKTSNWSQFKFRIEQALGRRLAKQEVDFIMNLPYKNLLTDVECMRAMIEIMWGHKRRLESGEVRRYSRDARIGFAGDRLSPIEVFGAAVRILGATGISFSGRKITCDWCGAWFVIVSNSDNCCSKECKRKSDFELLGEMKKGGAQWRE